MKHRIMIEFETPDNFDNFHAILLKKVATDAVANQLGQFEAVRKAQLKSLFKLESVYMERSL